MKKKGLILILLTAIISGISIFVNSISIKEFDSSIFTFSKNIVVALFLFSIILAFGKFAQLKALKRKQWIQLTIIGLVGGSIPFLLFFKGLQLTTGTTSAFIHKTMFIYIAIFALLFLKEKLNKWFILGTALLLIGNFFFIKPDFHFSIGHILIVFATLFWAAENTYAKYVVKEVSGTLIAFGRMFFGSLFILIFLSASGKLSLISTLTFVHIAWIILTAVLLLGYVLTFYNGIKYIKISTAACILAIGSPITTLLSFVFQAKAFSFNQAIGAFFILSGLLFIVWLNEFAGKIAEKEVVYGWH